MNPDSFQVFLFDIEGTVAPISFVHEVLFPYSRKKLGDYLKEHPLLEKLRSALEFEHRQDFGTGVYTEPLEPSPDSHCNYLQFLIRVDRKSPVLKEVQGEIWKRGYESGEIKSTLFEDTLPFFESLKKKDKKIYIYSSGSILAQKLIFGYSIQGNLNPLISGYFDTGVGQKRKSESYGNILRSLGVPAGQLCFFTDIQEEAEAASSLGITCFLMDREGNTKIEQPKYPLLKSFF